MDSPPHAALWCRVLGGSGLLFPPLVNRYPYRCLKSSFLSQVYAAPSRHVAGLPRGGDSDSVGKLCGICTWAAG